MKYSKHELKTAIEAKTNAYVDQDNMWINNDTVHYDYNKNGKFSLFGWRSSWCDIDLLMDND